MGIHNGRACSWLLHKYDVYKYVCIYNIYIYSFMYIISYIYNYTYHNTLGWHFMLHSLADLLTIHSDTHTHSHTHILYIHVYIYIYIYIYICKRLNAA